MPDHATTAVPPHPIAARDPGRGRRRPARLAAVLVALVAGALLQAAPAAAQARELCPERFHVQVEGERLGLPFCTTHPIDRPDARVERIVFSIHGVSTNAESYFRSMVRAAERVPGARERTLILAPQWMTAAYAREVPIGPTDLFWNTSSQRFWGGASGSTEDHPRRVSVSSFEVMDRLLAHLTEPGRFPNLRAVVVAGHSGGGQFTNRYAAASVLDHEALRARGVHVRYIVSNPSTYVYLDGERAVPGVRTRDAFAVPAAEAVRECPAWDSYGSGLNGLDAQWSYLAAVGAERMRRQFGARDVVYLLGMNDTDAEASDLARGCAAMLQGVHRLERGITYFNHVDRYYSERGGHRHRIGFVPRVGHDHAGIWGSDEGLLHIFDHWRWGTAAR